MGRDIPAGLVLHNAGKSLRPVMLHAQRHGKGQELLKSVGRHALDAVRIHPVHELLKAEDSHAGARPFRVLQVICRPNSHTMSAAIAMVITASAAEPNTSAAPVTASRMKGAATSTAPPSM